MKTIQIDYTAKKDGVINNHYKGDYPAETEDSNDGYSLYAKIERLCEGHDLILKIVDEFETFEGVTYKKRTTFSCGVCNELFKVEFAEKKSYGKLYLYDDEHSEPLAEYDLGAPLEIEITR